MIRQRSAAEGVQTTSRRTAACACALATLFALCLFAWPCTACADEVGGEGSFDLNLSMSVAAADDPDAPIHPVSMHVSNSQGEHVGGARVAYVLQSDFAPAASPASVADVFSSAAQAGSGMVRAGSAVTASDGMAELEGIVSGCDYLVSVEADGHTRYERIHTCKGEDGERWEVVMEKGSGSGGASGGTEPGGSSGGSGSVSGGGSSGASVGDGGADSLLRKLPTPLATGDALGPFILCAAGVLLVSLSLIALAFRRRDARDGR